MRRMPFACTSFLSETAQAQSAIRTTKEHFIRAGLLRVRRDRTALDPFLAGESFSNTAMRRALTDIRYCIPRVYDGNDCSAQCKESTLS